MDLAKLQALPDDTLQKPNHFELAEYQVLQAFYKAWEALHAIPNDKFHKKQKEGAAQALVEKAHVLRRMASDRQIILTPRFMQ